MPPQDEHGNLKAQTWTEALDVIRQRLQGVQGDQIRGIAGKLADAESMIALKVWLLFSIAQMHLQYVGYSKPSSCSSAASALPSPVSPECSWFGSAPAC